jgi:protein SCO1/2
MRIVATILFAVALYCSGCTSKQDDNNEAVATSIDTLPILRTVSAFSGIDQDSAAFNAVSMRGKIWVASFFFTRCGTVCPALNNVLAGLQRDIGARVSFVSLTSDPEFDTPSVMKQYAKEYGANEATWKFVTMPLDSMLVVASRDLGLIEPASPDIHSTRFVLIDSTMRVRGFYDSADTTDVAKLRRILKAL